ncbi:MAG: carboxylating nicotinate-nucleotide diphosphorylase [Bacteroidota bacterium]
MPDLPDYLNFNQLNHYLEEAIKEDIGPGDHSSLSVIDQDAQGEAKLVMKETGVLAGVEAARNVYRLIDNTLSVDFLVEDGAQVSKGDIVMVLRGSVRSILSAERLSLNILQRMSGIATKTHKLTELIKGTKAQLLDTRKTTPNFRMFEKWAVYLGGGTNHRFALYDMIMLKDNHNDYAGGITKAVSQAKTYLKHQYLNLKIEVETRSLDEVKEAFEAGADIIMLDNMGTEQMKEAVEIISNKCKVEASGGITEQNIREIAETGIDFISVGALTHSYKSLDMSLKAEISR